MRWWQFAQRDRDLERELQSDLELEEDEQRQNGLSPEEARYAARRALGNVPTIRGQTHEAWGVLKLEQAVHDLRYAWRALTRNPAFTTLAVITLAVGIGATCAIFSVINGVVLKPLPYPHPEELLDVRLKLPDVSASQWCVTVADYLTYREQGRSFRNIGAYDLGTNATGYSVNVTGIGTPEHVPALRVSYDLLSVLQVGPHIGRSFTREDEQPGSADTVILSYGYWRKHFGGDGSLVGKTLTVDGTPRVVIGILPQSFRFLDKRTVAMLIPLRVDRGSIRLGNCNYAAIARLKPGATVNEANRDVARMIPITIRSFPPYPGMSRQDFEQLRLAPAIQPLKQAIVGNVKQVLWVLMGGISLVLLIACANVANLLLLRGERRQQELTIRTALGASRARIAAGVFSESVVVGMLGGSLGVGLAYCATRTVIAFAPAGLPRIDEIGLDGAVVVFATCVSLVASLLFGCVPVFKFAGGSLSSRLREGGRSTTGSLRRHRSQALLVVVQVALALVLLVSSGLMIRTFVALSSVAPGFSSAAELQTFRIFIPDNQVRESLRVLGIEKEIADKIKALPGVSAVSMAENLPISDSNYFDKFFVKGHLYPRNTPPLSPYKYTAPGFFNTIGTPILAGRDFRWNDIYGKIPVIIVSEKFARTYWKDPREAVRKQVGDGPNGTWRQIVGVVGNIHEDGVDKEAPASLYFPILTSYGKVDYVSRDVAFAVRSRNAGSESLINGMRKAVSSVDPNLPLAEVRTLEYYYMRSMARTSFTLVMLCLAGGMALLLGVVGLYGVITYSVSQRTQELGIRMALGAQRSDVVTMIVGQGALLAAIGAAIGLATAFGLSKFLSSFLYGVKPSDPLTFASVAMLLMLVAVLASCVPARRASRVDPLVALRYE